MSVKNEHTKSEVEILRTSDFVPCVRYDDPEKLGLRQSPILSRMDEAVPEGSSYISPVYLLTDGQYGRLCGHETGWLGGDDGCIAKVLQSECEDAGKEGEVLYPVYIESDALQDGEPAETLFEWYRKFLTDLGIDYRKVKYYFSGNRSVHVHVPRFVVGEKGRKALRQKVNEFCERTDADLDKSIYDQKSLFRLPGAVHEKTDLPKVEVDFGDTRKDMVRKALSTENPVTPETGIGMLRQAFGDDVGRADHTQAQKGKMNPETEEAVSLLGGEDAVLELPQESDGGDIEIPLIEQKERPGRGKERQIWQRYNRHPFSPYANARGGERSVAIVEMKGKPFCRKSQKGINKGAFIPAYFWGAIGCDDEFTVVGNAPLRLSSQDYEKWSEREYQERDVIAVIGGRSRSSIIVNVGRGDGITAASFLKRESKKEALDYLEEEGYDIGSAGSEYKDKKKNKTGVRRKGKTEAEKVQLEVESGDVSIQLLTHKERLRIAGRLLWIGGWDEAFEWFRQAYGSDFDERITHTQLKGIVNKYEDFSHIEVP